MIKSVHTPEVVVIKESIWNELGLEPLVMATEGAAAFDIRSAEDRKVDAYSWCEKISTGFQFRLPPDLFFEIYSRSGLGLKGLVEAKGVGIIDSDYTHTVFVTLANNSPYRHTIKKGDRIAQGIFRRKIPVELDFIHNSDPLLNQADMSGTSSTRTGGFGSTGIE